MALFCLFSICGPLSLFIRFLCRIVHLDRIFAIGCKPAFGRWTGGAAAESLAESLLHLILSMAGKEGFTTRIGCH